MCWVGVSINGPPDPWKIILMIIDSKDYLNYDSIIFYVVRNTNSRHKLEAYITKYFSNLVIYKEQYEYM